MLPDSSRRRTAGGVFFHLVRTDPALSHEDRTYIFPPQFRRDGRKKTAGNTASVTPTPTSTPVPTGATTPASISSTVKRLDDHNLYIIQAGGAVISAIAIVLGFFAFFWQLLPEQENQARIQRDLNAWTIINAAQGQRASGGRIQAMRVLATDGESMAGLTVRSAVLTGVDVHGADLHGADLSDSILDGANLAHANLKGANLQKVRLMAANLAGADLLGANLQGASLFNANLQGANLNSSHLEHGNVASAAMQDATLIGAHWQGVNLFDASLQGVDLLQADLRGAHLAGADMQDANLAGADLQDADLSNDNLQRANLDYADLRHAILGRGYIQGRRITYVSEGANLAYASLAYAKLNNAFLFGVDLQHANLRKANLTDAYLYWANVQDSELSDAVGLTLSAVKTTENWRGATFTGYLCRLLPLPLRAVTVQGEQPIPYPSSTPHPTLVAWAPQPLQPAVWPTSTAITQLNLPPLSIHDLTAIPNLLMVIPSTPYLPSTPYPALYSTDHVEEGC